MPTLNRKHSTVFSKMADNTVSTASPAYKLAARVERGGGARLSASFDDLSGSMSKLNVEATTPKTVREAIHGDNGIESPALTRRSGGVDDVFASSPVTNSRGGQSSSIQRVLDSLEPLNGLKKPASHLGIRARADNVDAQAYYSATSCLFVANLPEHIRDGQLETLLTKAFSKWGMVFVKIRRDQRNMPYAFLQFTKDEHAQAAFAEGKGTDIEGRPCRIEPVKANRSFVLFSLAEEDVSADEAYAVMSAFGPVSKCEALHPQLQEAVGAKGGVLVEYTTFDSKRDVVNAFRNDNQYRVITYDLKKGVKKPRAVADDSWLRKCVPDRPSVYIGNLPTDVTGLEEKLEEIATCAGIVERVQVVQKDGMRGRNSIAFGFVDYKTQEMADEAVKQLSGTIFLGAQLRVERKTSKEPRAIYKMQSVPTFPDDSGKGLSTPRGVRYERSQQLGPAKSREGESKTPTTPINDDNGGEGMSSAPAPASAPPHANPYHFMPYVPHGFGMPFPHAATGFFPGTPGLVSPYHQMYGWHTPYIQDPGYPMGFYPPSFSMPTTASMGASAVAPPAMEDVDEDNQQTPTKKNPGGSRRLDNA